MDADRFDHLTVVLWHRSRTGRRALLGAVAGLILPAAASAKCKPVGADCKKNGDCCTGAICTKKQNARVGACTCRGNAEHCKYPADSGSCCFNDPRVPALKEVCVRPCGCCPKGKTKCCVGSVQPYFCCVHNESCCGDQCCLPTWNCCINSTGSLKICCAPLETCCQEPSRYAVFCCPVGTTCINGACL